MQTLTAVIQWSAVAVALFVGGMILSVGQGFIA
jgi:hypothetical protein